MGKTILSFFKMKSLIILAFLISVAVAIPATNECERKTEVLQNALIKLAKKNLDIRLDCTACFDDILAAVTDCFSITTNPLAIIQCVQDVIGVGNDCYSCICEVITDIGNLFGQDWHC